MSVLIPFGVAALLPPVSSWFWRSLLTRSPRTAPSAPAFYGGWMGSAVAGGVMSLVYGPWPYAAGSALSLAVALWLWWRKRKGRKPVSALIGAKSRAIRDGLVRRMREAAKPGPVLRPVPGGAG